MVATSTATPAPSKQEQTAAENKVNKEPSKPILPVDTNSKSRAVGIDPTTGKPRRHTIYEVTSIPALQSKVVPVKEKVRAFRKLKYSESIWVRQYFEDDVYDTTGFNMSNVYTVSVPNRFTFDAREENVLFYIGEKISCEGAWFKSSGRVVHFRVLNTEGTPVCTISRGCSPLSCICNPFPCCSRTQFYVSLPDGRYFGSVKKCFNLFKPKFTVLDAENKKLLEVTAFSCGNFCPMWLVSDAIFKIQRVGDDGELEEPVDFIEKSCTPICESTQYNLKLAEYVSSKNKMLLIALIVLIDFKHFRRCSTLCHLMTWFLWLAVLCAACGMLFYCTIVCPCFRNAHRECFKTYNPEQRNVDYDYP